MNKREREKKIHENFNKNKTSNATTLVSERKKM